MFYVNDFPSMQWEYWKHVPEDDHGPTEWTEVGNRCCYIDGQFLNFLPIWEIWYRMDLVESSPLPLQAQGSPVFSLLLPVTRVSTEARPNQLEAHSWGSELIVHRSWVTSFLAELVGPGGLAEERAEVVAAMPHGDGTLLTMWFWLRLSYQPLCSCMFWASPPECSWFLE